MANPSKFVTYHDAQTHPNYLYDSDSKRGWMYIEMYRYISSIRIMCCWSTHTPTPKSLCLCLSFTWSESHHLHEVNHIIYIKWITASTHACLRTCVPLSLRAFSCLCVGVCVCVCAYECVFAYEFWDQRSNLGCALSLSRSHAKATTPCVHVSMPGNTCHP